MGFVFLLVRIALGGFFAFRGVRYLDPYARQAAIASSRGKGSSSSDLAFVTIGLMMLTGGMCVAMGIAPGVGVAVAVTSLAIDSSRRFQKAAAKRTIAFVRIAGLAAMAVSTLFVPRPWPFSFIG